MRLAVFLTVILLETLGHARANDVQISCKFTEKMEVIRSGTISGDLITTAISEIANFTITEKHLVTSMVAPCGRMSGSINIKTVAVACKSAQPHSIAITIKIDRSLGTIEESLTFSGGSQSWKKGTCAKRQGF